MYNWRANSSMPVEKPWGYVQWKPVMYTSTSRLNADLSHVNTYYYKNWTRKHIVDNVLPEKSLVSFFFNLEDNDVSKAYYYMLLCDVFYQHYWLVYYPSTMISRFP